MTCEPDPNGGYPMKTLPALAAAYAQAKAEEARATTLRRDLAAQIQAATGHTGESQKTYTADSWKVTVKAPVIRSMNWDAWETVKGRIPRHLWPVEMKPTLDEKGVQWIKANDPQTYQILSEALTVKPGAVQVSVKNTAEGEEPEHGL